MFSCIYVLLLRHALLHRVWSEGLHGLRHDQTLKSEVFLTNSKGIRAPLAPACPPPWKRAGGSCPPCPRGVGVPVYTHQKKRVGGSSFGANVKKLAWQRMKLYAASKNTNIQLLNCAQGQVNTESETDTVTYMYTWTRIQNPRSEKEKKEKEEKG